MADYIIQKPVDFTKLTAKARKSLPAEFDITPKYDGCACVLLFDAMGRYISAYSATGEDVPSMRHVGEWIAQFWPVQVLRQRALIGEAWKPDTDFPTISGMFRRKRVQSELTFALFDIVAWEPGDVVPLLGDERPYMRRIECLDEVLYQPDYVIPAPHSLGSLDAANELALKWKAQGGFDGAIVRDPHAPYVVGRCKHEVIKVKPVLSLDLIVTDVFVEKGEKTGRDVFTLEVEHHGIRTRVGSGVPHKATDVPGRGQIAEVECMGLTPDGFLREPRFKGIRYDKAEAD